MKTNHQKAKGRAKSEPVLTLARRSAAVAVPASVQTILVPIDFSDHSLKALHYAGDIARANGCRLVLLHTVEPIATPDLDFHPLMRERDDVARWARTRLEGLAKSEGLAGCKTVVRHGTPYREITDAARSLKVDLIVISTHGYTGFKHVFLGSTAERVVRHAGCTVTVVR